MTEDQPRVLRDIGLVCPECGWPKLAATDSFCWRCGHVLGETWVQEQG